VGAGLEDDTGDSRRGYQVENKIKKRGAKRFLEDEGLSIISTEISLPAIDGRSSVQSRYPDLKSFQIFKICNFFYC